MSRQRLNQASPSRVPAEFSVVAAPAVPRALLSDPELESLAVAAGRAWADSTVGDLRSQDRGVSGGWPGTLREARGQVQLAITGRRGGMVSAERLDALARTANASARAAWGAQAEPDLEP